ncbi:hypothetical protein RHMOL_Rhmol02G0259000 [Rhododendron molle]|uniref:Uncharacterized protein n=1 Tax=Rhododendron molle TaxID=49168 RepID=A0ACC0PVV6_RHOML|nr:hypothetical protein RHMOL_Rhmol02G0259000 [Rhododendron molle]
MHHRVVVSPSYLVVFSRVEVSEVETYAIPVVLHRQDNKLRNRKRGGIPSGVSGRKCSKATDDEVHVDEKEVEEKRCQTLD